MEYPKELTKNRLNKEGLLLGDLFNDMLLIKEYKITEDIFMTDKGKFYFTILSQLMKKEIFTPTNTDIQLVLNDTLLETYNEYGGFERIKKLMKASNKDNFDSHYDQVMKNNLLLTFIDDGIDLTNTIEIKNKKGKTIEKTYLEIFDAMNCEQVLSFMQTRISDSIQLPSNNGAIEDDGIIGDDFINSLTEGTELGVPIDSIKFGNESIKFMPTINKEILGLRRGFVTGIGALVNQGKSTLMTEIAMSLAGAGEKVLYITNEMKINDVKLNFIAYTLANVLNQSNITKKKLKSGNLTPDELEKVKIAKDIYNENLGENIFLISINDSNLDQVKSFTRKYALSKGITCLLYDTFKADYATGDEDYKDLIIGSRLIDKLCREFNLVGVIALQISQSYAGNLILDISMLAGSKQVNEVLDSLILFRNLFYEELDNDHKYFCSPYTWVKDEHTHELVKKDVNIDKKGTYRIFFIVKTRDGNTFNDSNTAYLYSFQGKNASVKEICRCTPKRGTITQNYYSK